MSGIERIAAERRRQIEVEGWTLEHDDAHGHGEIVGAALCYLNNAGMIGDWPDAAPGLDWPWDIAWWKPEPRDGGRITCAASIRMLEKAGALIAAEIDRLERRIQGGET